MIQPVTPPINRIVVGTDLSPRSDRAIARAFALAGHVQAPVFVVCILDNAMPDEMVGALHDKAQAQVTATCSAVAGGVPFTTTVQPGDPTEELLRAAEPADGTLLVMGPHRPRPFLDALRETTMQRVARRTGAAVLMVREPVTGPYGAILSAVDYSPAGTAALRLGATLAPDAPITALHAIHVPYSGMLETTGSVQMELQDSFKHEADQMDAAWRAETDLPATLAARTDMRFAAPGGAVHDLTRDRQFDLITVGAHGRVGSRRSLLGSFALDLMRAAPCDVLVARG